MKIYRAQPEDADRLTEVAIRAKRTWNYPETWIRQWLPLLTLTPEYIAANPVFFTRNDHDEVLGFYALAGEGSRISLDHLWVAPEAAGRGMGRALFEHAATQAARLGAAELEIEADPNAQAFYERMGARKVGEQHTQIEGQPRVLPILIYPISGPAPTGQKE